LATTKINGLALFAVFGGSVFVYSGVKGKSITTAFQSIVQGKSPAAATQNEPISSTGDTTSGTAVSGGSAQQILQQTAAQFGWGSGAEWQALSNIEMAEAGFNPNARNASSGAFGLAQALHGYTGYGFTATQTAQANAGDASLQALWMCRYIQARYGDPIKAWTFHQANGWY
jgi:hypothetical protein